MSLTAPRASLDNAVVAMLFAVGSAIVFRSWLFTGFDGVFGDNADGELLIAIVEHWNHVFAGRAHWASPIFFYPERGTLGFTDALFLYGFFHAGLRALGFDTFLSFMIVMAALGVIGFFGFFRLARRHFAVPTLWAAVGAFLFAFANMIAVKLIHAQAYCAMLLPLLCDLVLTAWSQTRRSRATAFAAAAGLLHALIFFTAYQTAWFFAFFLILSAALHPFVFGPARTWALIGEVADKWHVAAAYAVSFAIGIVPFLMVYLPVVMSGRSRDLAEIAINAPEARDILNVTTANLVWGEVLRHLGITGVTGRPWWEPDLGYAPTVFIVLLATTAMLAKAALSGKATLRDRWLLVFALAVLVSWLLQLEYFGYRPWAVVWTLVPGAKGIRYIFRSQIVANLFAALVVARGMWALTVWSGQRRLALGLVGAVAGLMLVEQINTEWPPALSRRVLLNRIAAIPPLPEGCRVFYLVPGAEPLDLAGWIHQEQAALIAEVLGVPTVNGYSSWLPDGWDLEEPAKPSYAAAVRAWAARKGVDGLCGLDPLKAKWTLGPPQ